MKAADMSAALLLLNVAERAIKTTHILDETNHCYVMVGRGGKQVRIGRSLDKCAHALCFDVRQPIVKFLRSVGVEVRE